MSVDASDRKQWEEAVAGPGKFEGEPAYVPYFYEFGLNTQCDYEAYDALETYYQAFKVRENDTSIFPELVGTYAVVLWESDNGFVNSASFDSEEDFDKAWSEIENDGQNSDGD